MLTRITNNMRFTTIIDNLNRAQNNYSSLMEQMSSQKKINRPSDDPVGATRVLDYRSARDSIAQYGRNIENADAWLKLTETKLGNIGDLIAEARNAGVNNQSSETAQVLAQNVGSLLEEILSLANSKFGDRYLFSGSRTDGAPFERIIQPVANSANIFDGSVYTGGTYTGTGDKSYTVRIAGALGTDYEVSEDGGVNWSAAVPIPVSRTVNIGSDGLTVRFGAAGTTDLTAGDLFYVNAYTGGQTTDARIDTPEAAGNNTYAGGTVTQGGTYTGLKNKTYVVKIESGGDLAAATYQHQLPLISSPGHRALLSSIRTVDAGHAAWIRLRAGVAPVTTALDEPVEDVQQLLEAFPARHALAARLLGEKLQEVARDVDHAGPVVHDDHAAGAHHRARLGQPLVVDGQVEQGLGDAATRGAAGLDRLERAVAEDPTTDVEDDPAQGRPHRQLDEAGVLDLADQRKRLGALRPVGAHGSEPLAAAVDDRPDAGPGLDVVEHRRQVEEALVGRVHVLGAGLADLALQRAHQGGRLPAHEGAAAARDPDVEVEARPHDALAEQPQAARLLQRDGQVDHGQRVLVADVDETLVGADRPGADHHALEHRVRVALHDRAVLERSRVALVAVAQHEAPIARRAPARPPLAAGVEAGAAAAALARDRHLLDHLVRRHLEEGLGKPRVGALGDRIEDVGRVDAADVAHRHPQLVLVERDLRVGGDPLAVGRVLVGEARDDLAAEHGLLDDLLDVCGLDLGVEDARRQQRHQRSALAEAVASGGLDEGPDRRVEPPLRHLLREGLGHLLRARRQAPGAAADQDLLAAASGALARLCLQRLEVGSRLNSHRRRSPCRGTW